MTAQPRADTGGSAFKKDSQKGGKEAPKRQLQCTVDDGLLQHNTDTQAIKPSKAALGLVYSEA
jgi:hypothetical protein